MTTGAFQIPLDSDLGADSSRGRGIRAAGWFADFLALQRAVRMQSLVLEGGIKGWVAAGPVYTAWIDEYDARVWQ